MRQPGAAGQRGTGLPLPSQRLLATFHNYLRWYVPRAFHAVRLAHPERFPALTADSRTIICFNHASWWDPIMGVLLARRFMPRLHHYAPMEAVALRRYGFFRRIGMFPVETQSARGAAAFLHAADAVLAQPNTVLWITPEGQFTDVRQRPIVWRPGVAALVARQPHCTVVPVALEYTFWDERLPEALGLVGEPVRITDGSRHGREHWQVVLTEAMTNAQNQLATLAMQRAPSNFSTLLQGSSGVAFFYDAWSRMRSRWRGQHFDPKHSSVVRTPIPTGRPRP